MAETKLGQDAVTLPVGTTVQRPSNPEAGMIRFNTDQGSVEWYDEVYDFWYPTNLIPVVATGGTVTDITQDGQLFRVHTFTSSGTFNVTRGGEVDVLVVGGGGAGGPSEFSGAGGGGAGGLVYASNKVLDSGVVEVSVGAGGEAIPFRVGLAADNALGEDSKFAGVTALGGGAGSGAGYEPDRVGLPGGSGGGHDGSGNGTRGTEGLQPGTNPVVILDAGNDGGGFPNPNDPDRGGGGGGAAEKGEIAASNTQGGNGGDGLYFGDKFGDNVGEDGYFAGGGGAGSRNSPQALGGIGGGGKGVGGSSDSAESGLPNTGGGGGGAANSSSTSKGGDGGSGIVIVRYRIG